MRKLIYAAFGLTYAAFAGVAVGSGCGGGDNAGSGASASTGTMGTSAGGNGTGGAGGSGTTTYTAGVGGAPTEIVQCQAHTYQCGDLVDNDNDGLIDYQDPDCLGPCDNTEDSFFGGIPGQAGPPCLVDCYFDQDSGQGNDQCYWSHWCDPNEVSPTYYPEPQFGAQCAHDENKPVPVSNGAPQSCDDLYNAQSQTCYSFCGPLTPNGCDCFGCCELPAGSGSYVWLGSTGADGTSVCSMADLADPTKCHPCLPVAACLNDCGPCEVCIGKPTVDPGCNPGTGGGGGAGGGQCPEGVQPCGQAGQEECPANYYCITGCCYEAPQ